MGISCDVRGQTRLGMELAFWLIRSWLTLFVDVRHKSDRIMAIKVLVEAEIVNVVSVYTPQISLPDNIKNQFWEDLDMVIQDVPQSEKLFIRGDFNGHIGVDSGEYDTAHESFSYEERNNAGVRFWTFRLPINYWW